MKVLVLSPEKHDYQINLQEGVDFSKLGKAPFNKKLSIRDIFYD